MVRSGSYSFPKSIHTVHYNYIIHVILRTYYILYLKSRNQKNMDLSMSKQGKTSEQNTLYKRIHIWANSLVWPASMMMTYCAYYLEMLFSLDFEYPQACLLCPVTRFQSCQLHLAFPRNPILATLISLKSWCCFSYCSFTLHTVVVLTCSTFWKLRVELAVITLIYNVWIYIVLLYIIYYILYISQLYWLL